MPDFPQWVWVVASIAAVIWAGVIAEKLTEIVRVLHEIRDEGRLK